jgi:predicted outer membrane repeat protein
MKKEAEMKSQAPGFSSTEGKANRQALTCIALVSLVGCGSIVVAGLLVWYLTPQVFPWIAAQLAKLFNNATVLYVKPEGTSRSCDSWENACGLQTALALATDGDEIWVQAGIYKPAADTRFPEATFQLKAGVALYGGFAGTETARDQRDWETHLTVLSGDLGGDDRTGPNGIVTDTADILGKNSYHVVSGSNLNKTAILDGFVITAGYASQTPPNIHGFGGGMFNRASSPTLTNLVFSGNTAGKGAAYYGGGGMFNSLASNPVLTHVTFVANTAGSGGGMYNDRSNPSLNDVTFSGNKAIDNGGMINYQGSSPTLKDVTFESNVASRNAGGMGNYDNGNPILNNVTFQDNSAKDYGGGMSNYQSSPTLTDVEFSNNWAGREGGGMHNAKFSQPVLINVTFIDNSTAANGGGMLNTESSPTLTNTTFSGNSAGEYGGGICNTFSSGPKLTNVTITGNRAPHGSGVCNVGGSFELVNGIVWGNVPAQEQVYNDNVKPDITYSDIEGNFPGVGNLNVDPRFGDFGDYGGPTRLFALQAGSPVIDQGSPSVCPATDQLGLSRPVDGDGNDSEICDMGAFEYRTPD